MLFARSRPHVHHCFPHCLATLNSLCIEFNSYRIRSEIVQEEIDFKNVVLRAGVDPHLSETQQPPVPLDRILPI